MDAPATLDRVPSRSGDPFRALIPRYDLVLTYGGGDPVVGAYRALGRARCVPIYNALDPATHHPVPPTRASRRDLGFLGNRLPDREARVEEFFFERRGAATATALPAGRQRLGGQAAARATCATSGTSTPPTTTPSTARRAPC